MVSCSHHNLLDLKKSSSRTRARREQIEDELEKAIKAWSVDTRLTFTKLRPENADEAHIRISFETGVHSDGYPFDGKGSILAHAFFPGTGQGGDAHFDDEEIWLVDNNRPPNGEGTRLRLVAAHEFGHSLGLSHSDVEGALMYPWYQNLNEDSPLDEDDKRGIQYIYGFKASKTWNPYPDQRPTSPKTPQKTPPKIIPKTTQRPYRPIPGGPAPERPAAPPTTEKPKACDSSYDAISVIRSELFIFKGRYFWRFNKGNGLEQRDIEENKRYPQEIVTFWPSLPRNLTHVDAVYERRGSEVIFFIGKHYWIFNGNKYVSGPLSLESLGIKSVDKIDGAMTWGHNGKTYLFSGSEYWRLDDTNRSHFFVEPDYPRGLYVWKGVPYNIDSVLKWRDNKVYFFKGKVFWKFDDKTMSVASETPSLSAPFWMGCTSLANPVDASPASNLVHDTSIIFSSHFLLITLPLLHTLIAYSLNPR